MEHQATLQYIFFHQQPYQQFKQFLQQKNIRLLQESIDATNVEGLVVHVADDLDDALHDEVEAFYERMLQLNEELIVAEESEVINNAGIAVTLDDGRCVLAAVDPDVLNRILAVISRDELGELVDAVADAIEHPDQQALCKRR